MSGPTVWIAVHDLSLTGVPIVLERMLAAVSPAVRDDVHVIALVDGPMRPRIAALVSSVHTLEPATGRSWAGATGVGLGAMGLRGPAALVDRIRWRLATRRLPSPDVLVLHGAGSWPMIDAVAPGLPVVLHLHELDSALERCVPRADRGRVFQRAHTVMAVAEPVADLALRCGARGSAVEVVPGVADSGPVQDRAGARRLLGGGQWVLGSGRPGWRKGSDRMAALSYELDRREHAASVGWVGGRPVGHDAEWVDAADPVRWFDERPDPWTLLAGASVLVIPSREDPLPLLALEAGRHRLPVVSTPTGGLPALLEGGRGLVAPAQGVRPLCDLVEVVLGSPDLADALGTSLAAHVERHHRAEVVAPQWWQLISSAAGAP